MRIKPHLFYIKIGPEKDQEWNCTSEEDVEICRWLARRYGLKFDVVDLHDDYWEKVVGYTMDKARKGLTPNPDVMCNKLIKFGCFEDVVGKNFDYIATGHYARIDQLANGRYSICTSKTSAKDQTYALYNLTQEQLSKTLMPVGAYTKDEIRGIAEEIGLMVKTNGLVLPCGASGRFQGK